jgi:hypothetical protein
MLSLKRRARAPPALFNDNPRRISVSLFRMCAGAVDLTSGNRIPEIVMTAIMYFVFFIVVRVNELSSVFAKHFLRGKAFSIRDAEQKN